MSYQCLKQKYKLVNGPPLSSIEIRSQLFWLFNQFEGYQVLGRDYKLDNIELAISWPAFKDKYQCMLYLVLLGRFSQCFTIIVEKGTLFSGQTNRISIEYLYSAFTVFYLRPKETISPLETGLYQSLAGFYPLQLRAVYYAQSSIGIYFRIPL